MRGQFNFFIPILRLIGLIAPSLFLYVVIITFPESGDLWSIFLLFLFSVVVYRLIRSIIEQRFTFEITEGGINVIDLVGVKSQFIDYKAFKGYSQGVIKTRLHDFEELVLYCENGDVYLIPQYGFFNFRKLKEELNSHSELRFLGKERIEWTFEIAIKDLVVRQYRFK